MFNESPQRMSKAYKIALILLLSHLPLMAQAPERNKLQNELDNLSTTLQRVRQQQQILSLQADSLAQLIQRRKQQTQSLLQERSLDGLLRVSQTLADSLQALQTREQKVDVVLRQKAEALLKILNGDIARLVKENEALKKRGQTPERESLGRELLQCREWRQRCQNWLEQPPPAIIIYQVETQPDDTPETLRRKADFLRDQSDRVRREVKRLETKVAAIRDETQVRQRMDDLAADLALLDPNRDGVVSSPASAEFGASGLTPQRDTKEATAGLSTSATAPLPFYQNWPAQLEALSFEDLERWRGQLEKQKKQRQAQADSLMKRAAEIEKQMNAPVKEKRP